MRREQRDVYLWTGKPLIWRETEAKVLLLSSVQTHIHRQWAALRRLRPPHRGNVLFQLIICTNNTLSCCFFFHSLNFFYTDEHFVSLCLKIDLKLFLSVLLATVWCIWAKFNTKCHCKIISFKKYYFYLMLHSQRLIYI